MATPPAYPKIVPPPRPYFHYFSFLFIQTMMLTVKYRSWQRPLLGIAGTAVLTGSLLLTGVILQRRMMQSPYSYPYKSSSPVDVTGRLEQELAFYKQRIQQNSEDGLDQAAVAAVYINLAKATGDANWYLLAEQAAQLSLTHLPFNNVGALLAQASIAEAKHDFDQSIKLAQQVLTIQPHQEGALALLVTAYLGQGAVEQASTVADQLVSQTPTMGSYTLRALVAIAKGQDAAALQNFKNALAVEEPQAAGSSAWTRTLMGRYYASRGNTTQARQLYREALSILPRYPLALVHLAQLETQLGHYQAANRLYEQVFISRDYPNVWDHVALQGMADVAQLQGRLQKAEALWQQAETLFRQHQNLSTFGHRRELARLLLARGHQADLPEALALIEADLTVRRDPETLDTYAWVLTRLKHWSKARTALQEAMATGIRDARIFYRAGLVETQLGNTGQATHYFQQSQATDPKFDAVDQQLWGLQ